MSVCEACSWPRGTCAAAELVELSKRILNGGGGGRVKFLRGRVPDFESAMHSENFFLNTSAKRCDCDKGLLVEVVAVKSFSER